MSNDAPAPRAGSFTRPEPPSQAPDGSRWEAVRADREWGIAQPDKDGASRTCRFRGRAPKACGAPATLVRMHGIGRVSPWFFCADDALRQYGVWAEDGKVMTWELKDDPA